MMGGILGPLRVEKLDDGRTWMVLESFRYYLEWPATADGLFVDVPASFLTDFASVPALGKPFIDPVGKIGKAAVVHDKLYQAPVINAGGKTSYPLSRAQCDQVFRDAMQACGVGWLERQTAWLAVRAGGWVPWNRYRKEDEVTGHVV